MIQLGPLLGLETENKYSVCFITPKSFDCQQLQLRLYYGTTTKCVDVEQQVALLHHYFYRFSFEVPIQTKPYAINYQIFEQETVLHNALDNKWLFHVPAVTDSPKIGFASCNGHEKKSPAQLSYQMWTKMAQEHQQFGFQFHALVMMGDQVYADQIWKKVTYFKEKKLLRSNRKMENYIIPVEDYEQLEQDISNFYEQLYINSWGRYDIRFIMAAVPSIMVWDDHDIFDGWGSHPPKLQASPIFQLIYKVAKKYFELFQLRTTSNSALMSKQKTHYCQQLSFRNYEFIILDNRSQRTPQFVMSQEQYKDLEDSLCQKLFRNTHPELQAEKTLCFVIPIPLAHVKYKKITARVISSLFKNNFRHSLNDDSLDYWNHKTHEQEHKEMVELIFEAGYQHQPSYLVIYSGDAHSAGTSSLQHKSNKCTVNQIISSAIVHPPISRFLQVFLSLFAAVNDHIGDYKIKMQGFESTLKKIVYTNNYSIMYQNKNTPPKAFLRTTETKMQKLRYHILLPFFPKEKNQ